MTVLHDHPTLHRTVARPSSAGAEVPLATVQGSLALDPWAQPTHREPPWTGEAQVVTLDPQRRLRDEAWCRRFAQAVVEVVGGSRPVSQLVRWTSREVHADLGRRALLVARAGAQAGERATASAVTPRVRSVHTSHLGDGVLEAAVHLRYGERSRALAARFEWQQDRWLCTALEFA